MEESRKSFLPGIALIAVGTILLLQRMDLISFRWRDLYPLLMLAISGTLYAMAYFKDDKKSSFPAGILLVLGVFFFLRNYDLFSFDFYFYYPGEFWPIFLLAIGFGYISRFLFDRSAVNLLVPAAIWFGLGVLFMLGHAGFLHRIRLRTYWPLILIAVGAGLVISNLRGKRA